jgi:hypothetical protein
VVCVSDSGPAGWSGYSPLGGASCHPSTSSHWQWDGGGWTLGSPSASNPARPMLTGALTGRTGYGLAAEPQRHVVLLFGGVRQGGFEGDTWIWDGSSWSRAQP